MEMYNIEKVSLTGRILGQLFTFLLNFFFRSITAFNVNCQQLSNIAKSLRPHVYAMATRPCVPVIP